MIQCCDVKASLVITYMRNCCSPDCRWWCLGGDKLSFCHMLSLTGSKIEKNLLILQPGDKTNRNKSWWFYFALVFQWYRFTLKGSHNTVQFNTWEIAVHPTAADVVLVVTNYPFPTCCLWRDLRLKKNLLILQPGTKQIVTKVGGFLLLWYFSGIVSHSRVLQVSQYVSVESSSLTQHRP